MKGSYPRGHLAKVVAGILSDRLGEIIEVGAIWPGRTPADARKQWNQDIDLPWSEAYIGHALRQLLEHGPEDGTAAPAPISGSALVAAGVDWLTAPREPLRASLRGAEVTPDMVDTLVHRAEQLRALEKAQGGKLVAGWILHDLRWASRLAREGAYDAATGVRLYRVIAELAQLVGWLVADLGDQARGHRYLLAGLRAASLAGDRDLGAYILSCLGYHLMWYGSPQDALRLIKIAAQGADGGTAGTVRSLLATRQARAHAQLGERTACETALMRAAGALAETCTGDAPTWSRWVNRAVLEADAGRARLELGHPDRAEAHLMNGLRELGRHQQRNRLLHQLSVAEARLALREVEGAAEATRAALAMARDVRSGRAHRRLLDVQARFSVYDTEAAHEMNEVIHQSLEVCGSRD
ncbi:hypothetical protein [Amycolatopsis sp. NPDC059021]|uniref:hypothetical protein n=1 Tax=Amycolatopsis sp. NPDC059021 TaxID=3346704 RepID=UPI00366C6536